MYDRKFYEIIIDVMLSTYLDPYTRLRDDCVEGAKSIINIALSYYTSNYNI